MSGRISKFRRTKSSKVICEERYCCDGENQEAVFECEDCRTKQCQSCESKLHEIPKYEAHDRRRLQGPSPDKLCQLKCTEKNYADVRCKQCHLNFCHECFDKMHAHGRRKNHDQETLKLSKDGQLAPRQLDKGVSDVVETDLKSNKIEGIKPLSPLEDDDSLTYLSMPQSQEDQQTLHSQTNIGTNTPILSSVKFDIGQNSSMKELSRGNPLPPDDDIVVYQNQSCRENDSVSEEIDIMEQLSLDSNLAVQVDDDEIYSECKSFLLVDQNEQIQVRSEEEFLQKLGCENDAHVKVVSIFGNTGDGKSHTLNHTFFAGQEVFPTSANQLSCTVGVWAAHDPVHNAIILDTEGLLGATSNQNQRTRLLLKVLAISDVIIYRTRADRLHNDMFHFLGDASKAYMRHFTQELRAASHRCKMDRPLSTLGPAVIIFHETTHTDILGKDSPTERAEMMLRRRFADLELMIEAFSAVQYVGTRTTCPPTDFRGLLLSVKLHLRNTSVRSPRRPDVIYNALQVLNQKFSGDIEKSIPCTFPDQYFTCNARCLSCGVRCGRTMNHLQDSEPHDIDQRCKYQHQYENKIFTCKACYDQGKCVVVVPKTSSSRDNTWFGLAKYAWAGYVLECPNCGIIFRSRQYWYGNQDPERSVVRTEIKHVWPGGNTVLQGTHNAARRLLDSINYASQTVADLSAKPAKLVGNWVADQIAPDYWVPNAQIRECHQCKEIFTEKIQIHHCRACGQGFCEECSLQKRPVPERGWGMEPVRVCDSCFDQRPSQDARADPSQLRARRVGEAISSTIGVVASAVDYPKDMLLESARPAYWKPDHQIHHCIICEAEFGMKLSKHHCRACGEGVCDSCSKPRRPVPSRGWDHPVRICLTCSRKADPL